MIKNKDIILINKDEKNILRKKSSKIDFPINKKLEKKIQECYETVKKSQKQETNIKPAVGLAANQIGIDKRFFVIYYEDDEFELKDIFINPKIVEESLEEFYLKDGEDCLSIPDKKKGIVKRKLNIKVEYFNLKGNKKIKLLTKIPSIIFQHELDHLNGILYIDKLEN